MNARSLLPFNFFAKLAPRERTLLLITLGVVFCFINIFLFDSFISHRRALVEKINTQHITWEGSKLILAQSDFWNERNQWITAHQPVLKGSTEKANSELLNQIKTLAEQNHVVLENPQFATEHSQFASNDGDEAASTKPTTYQPIAVRCTAKGDWNSLVHFLAAVQEHPSNFLVPEEVSLRSNTSDPTQMIAELRISKWYAPGQK